MAVNMHASGPCVAVFQAYRRQSTGSHMAINRHIHSKQKANKKEQKWYSMGIFNRMII